MLEQQIDRVTIRKANRMDLEGLLANRMDFIYSLKGIRAPKTFEDLTYEYMDMHLDDDTFAAWIAELDGKIVSACMLCITQQIPTPICLNGKIGYLYNVFTQEEYRNHGLASELVKEVQEYAIKNKILAICLKATDSGLPVYKKRGFILQNGEMTWNQASCPVNRGE